MHISALLRKRLLKAVARSGLLAAVFLAAASQGAAQESLLDALFHRAPNDQVVVVQAEEAPRSPGAASTVPGSGPDSPPAAEGAPATGSQAAEKKDGEKKDGEKKDGEKKEKPPFWTTVPHLSPLPRAGNFPIFPTGPGYYSLWDVLTNNYRENAPKTPWPPISPDIYPFYDADFRYLDDPKNKQHDWLDPLKRIHPAPCWLLSLGGEERFQYKDETANGARLNGQDNIYQLQRLRLYGDLWYSDVFRVYAEFIDAHTFNQDLPPLAIDVNGSDLLNLFTDVKLFSINNNPVYFRGGRQELVYGSQRLISPLDWANTRRTFEGFKGFYRSEKLDVDAFWVRPVQIFPGRFDAAEANRQFTGLWTTYRPQKGRAIDVYYLFLDQHSPVGPGPVPPGGRGGQNINTVGSRWVGDKNHYLWDFEGMYQFGTITNNAISAGAATAGLGYQFADLPWTPIFWVYNDYASGDDKGGRGGTFNQLFPFGHYYFGFIDAVGRQNIDDVNLHLNFFPAKWIMTSLQAHFFYLASGRDALYNTAGVATRRDPTGRSGLHVGDEVDWVTNFHLSNHQDILVGYSQLLPGEFIRNTGSARSPGLFYLQYSYKW